MIGMTRRQSDCLAFIKAFIVERSIPPTFEEIADGLQLKSKSSVERLVGGLEGRNLIRRIPGRARAIEIVTPENMQAVLLNSEIYSLVRAYAWSQRIGLDCAANELLRNALGAA
jgi:SOS-response transcriptional repressor LexA